MGLAAATTRPASEVCRRFEHENAALIAGHGSTKNVQSDSLSYAGAIAWNYDRTEILADALIHIVGVSRGLIATGVLLAVTAAHFAALELCEDCYRWFGRSHQR